MQRVCNVLLSATLLLVLTGCPYPTTMPEVVWNKASALCSGLGGVKAVTNRGTNSDKTGFLVTAYCKSDVKVDAVISGDDAK